MMLSTSPSALLRLFLSLFVLLVSSPLRARALTNVTVDRNSPAVSYSPMDPGLWREGWPGVRISGDGRAKAAFGFTGEIVFSNLVCLILKPNTKIGVAIYYQGWLWSQPTTFLAQVDDRMPITLDLTDRTDGQPADNATAVPRAAVTILITQNLTEAPHQVVLSKGDGQREVIVGSFM